MTVWPLLSKGRRLCDVRRLLQKGEQLGCRGCFLHALLFLLCSPPKKRSSVPNLLQTVSLAESQTCKQCSSKKKKKKHKKIDFFNTHTHTQRWIKNTYTHPPYMVINAMLLKLFHTYEKAGWCMKPMGGIKCARTHEGSGYKEVPWGWVLLSVAERKKAAHSETSPGGERERGGEAWQQ